MESVVGIFRSLASAEQVEDLMESGMAEQSIVFLSNQAPEKGGSRAESEEKLDEVPTTDAEGDGMGKAMGAVVGGAVGASAGMAAGATVAASLLVPGVGTIFAIGVGAAAALGLGGAAAGAKAGDVAEHAVDAGIPRDDVEFYREMLRRGHSIVIANVESEADASRAREIFKQEGSEDVASARKELRKAA